MSASLQSIREQTQKAIERELPNAKFEENPKHVAVAGHTHWQQSFQTEDKIPQIVEDLKRLVAEKKSSSVNVSVDQTPFADDDDEYYTLTAWLS